jgi:putative toxin-antitoxin system antitoxin component (TIGR02293 family)
VGSKTLAQALQSVEDAQLNDTVVSRVVGISPRTVKRWRASDVEPQLDAGERLLRLAYISRVALKVMDPEDVRWWIFDPNEALGGRSTADCIDAGDHTAVIDLLEALADGVMI